MVGAITSEAASFRGSFTAQHSDAKSHPEASTPVGSDEAGFSSSSVRGLQTRTPSYRVVVAVIILARTSLTEQTSEHQGQFYTAFKVKPALDLRLPHHSLTPEVEQLAHCPHVTLDRVGQRIVDK